MNVYHIDLDYVLIEKIVMRAVLAAVAYNCGHRCKKKGRWYGHTKVTRGYFRRYQGYVEGGMCEAR